MSIKSKDQLKNDINTALADNNAGLISAADVRTSIIDTVDSITNIVATADFKTTPFTKDLKLQTDNGVGGILEVGSGIRFLGANGNQFQYVPYPGPGSILHNDLGGRNIGDPHEQYVSISGHRPMLNNLALGNVWVNSSGNTQTGNVTSDGRGLQFQYVNNYSENINVGSGTGFTFLKDKSVLNSSRGVAKAWIRFEASGLGGDGRPAVLDAYNVSGIKKEDIGKFTIIFNSGILKNNNYVAVGHSNGRSTSSSREDFSENTVAMTYRAGNDTNQLRSISFVVMGEDYGSYLDGKVNDLVIFGTEPNGSGYADHVVINPDFTASV